MNYRKIGPDWWPLNERTERPFLRTEHGLHPLVFGTKGEAVAFVEGRHVPTYPHTIATPGIEWHADKIIT